MRQGLKGLMGLPRGPPAELLAKDIAVARVLLLPLARTPYCQAPFQNGVSLTSNAPIVPWSALILP